MAHGLIKNENFISIEPNFERWDSVSKKLLPFIEMTGQLEGPDQKNIEVKLFIQSVLTPSELIQIRSLVGESVITNHPDLLIGISVVNAQNFILNDLLKNAWALIGHIMTQGGNVPVTIVYYAGLQKAAYCLPRKHQFIRVPHNPQEN